MRIETIALGMALTVACGGGNGGLTEPQQAPLNPASDASAGVESAAASNASPTHGVALTCFAGPCDGAAGTVNFSAPARPVKGAAPGFGVVHEGVYTVHGAPPNTTYLLQRALDFTPNGICTGAFITWPIPVAAPLARLTTSPAGAGAAHFTFEFAGGIPGVPADITFRLIEESPNPGGTDLRTACGSN